MKHAVLLALVLWPAAAWAERAQDHFADLTMQAREGVAADAVETALAERRSAQCSQTLDAGPGLALAALEELAPGDRAVYSGHFPPTERG